jgi:hypothetical protein
MKNNIKGDKMPKRIAQHILSDEDFERLKPDLKEYYLVEITTMYDGLEFHDKFTYYGEKVTKDEIEKFIKYMYLHVDTDEKLLEYNIKEIPREVYDMFKKYRI